MKNLLGKKDSDIIKKKKIECQTKELKEKTDGIEIKKITKIKSEDRKVDKGLSEERKDSLVIPHKMKSDNDLPNRIKINKEEIKSKICESQKVLPSVNKDNIEYKL